MPLSCTLNNYLFSWWHSCGRFLLLKRESCAIKLERRLQLDSPPVRQTALLTPEQACSAAPGCLERCLSLGCL